MKAATNEVWARADHLVKQYGETAPEQAALEADREEKAGHADEQVTWLRVVAASKAVLARDDVTSD